MNPPVLTPVFDANGRMITATPGPSAYPKVTSSPSRQPSAPPDPYAGLGVDVPSAPVAPVGVDPYAGLGVDAPVQASVSDPYAGLGVEQPAPAAPVVQSPDGGIQPISAAAPINPTAESGMATFGREAATHVIPAVGGLGGALAGGAALAPLGAFTGPAAPIAIPALGVIGAIAGGLLGEAAITKAQRWVREQFTSKEELARQDAQEAANAAAHPNYAGAGTLLGEAPTFLAGGGVAKLGKAALEASKVGKAAIVAGKGATLAQKALLNVPGQVGGVASFGVMQGGATASEMTKEGSPVGLGDVASETAKGMLAGGVIGLIPGAKSFLGKYAAKPGADAAAMAISNAVYDNVVKGTPIDPADIVKQTGGSIPTFVVVTAIQGLLHRQLNIAAAGRSVKEVQQHYRDRITSIGIPAEKVGDWPARFAAAKTPEEYGKLAVEFSNQFADVLPKPETPPAAPTTDANGAPVPEAGKTAGVPAALATPSVVPPETTLPPVTPAIKATEGQTTADLNAVPGASTETPSPVPVVPGTVPSTDASATVPLPPKAVATPPTGQGIQLGAATEVHGTKGQKFPAQYAVVARVDLVASHEGQTFTKNADYPLENSRDYSNPAEQAKVHAVRTGFASEKHVTDSVDASVGPVMVAGVINEKGVRQLVVLGGNNREMAIQTMAPAKRQALADFTNTRADRFGLPSTVDANHEVVRFMGEYDLRQAGTREKLQGIIESLNPAPGKVQSHAEMADVDASVVPLKELSGLRLDISPKDASAKVEDLIAAGHLDRNLRSQIAESPASAQAYVRRLLVQAAFKHPGVADFIGETTSKSAAARGMIEAAAPGVLELRAKGQNELADAFSKSMATLVDYINAGDDIRVALDRSAKQIEMDKSMAIVQDVAEVMRRSVAVSPKNKVIAEDTIDNFNEAWKQIHEGLMKWDANPDMFGGKVTAEEGIRSILARINAKHTFDNGEVKYSTGTGGKARHGTVKARQGQYLVDEMMKSWKNPPEGGVVVVQDEAGLVDLGLSAESRQAVLNNRAEGFYHIPSKTVYIMADNLQRPSDVIRVALHETIGHYGLRESLGEEFGAEMDRMGALIPAKDLQAIADKYGADMNAEDGKRLAVEEYLSKEAAARNPTLWQQFVKAIRTALKRIGVNEHILDKWDTRGEVEKMVDASRDYVERGTKGETASAPSSGEVRLSKPEPDDREFKLETVSREQLRSEDTLRKQNAEAKRKIDGMKAKLAAPLTGGMGDTTGDMFGATGKNDIPLFTGGKDIRMAKADEPMMAQHKSSKHQSENERMDPVVRKAMEARLYEVRAGDELIATVMKHIDDKGVIGAGADFFNADSKLQPDERITMGQALMQAHNDMAVNAAKGKDQAYVSEHLNTAIEIGHKLDEYGLQYGRAVQSFTHWSHLLSTLEGAQRLFEKDKAKFVASVRENNRGIIDEIKRMANEANGKAFDETMLDAKTLERVNAVLHRLGMNARNGMDARMNTAAGRKAAQAYFSDPANSDIATPAIRWSKGSEDLDAKIFSTAKRGARVMWQNGTTSFDAFSKAMLKESGPNVEPHLQRIYNEASILYNNLLSNSGKVKGADTRVNRSVQAEVKGILKDWFAGDANADRAPVLDLLKAAGLTEKDAVALVMDVQNRFIERARTIKDARMAKLLRGRVVGLTNPKAVSGLVELSNLTPLSDPVINGQLSRKYGLPEMTPMIASKLNTLANAIRDAPEGSAKDNATREMLNFMRKQMPVDWKDVGWSMWYANILSGYQTAERNTGANVLNAIDNMGASMLTEPRNAPFALMGFARGIGAGVHAAADVMRTGNFPVRIGKFEMSSSLELNPFKGPAAVFNNWKYVLRSLWAADMLLYKPSQEARAYMIAADVARTEGKTGVALWARTNEIMGNSDVQRGAFQQQAADEGVTGGGRVKMRAQELAESQRPKEMRAEASDYAARATMNFPPEGVLGMLSGSISKLSQKMPALKLAIPFTRIVANVANMQMDHTPWGFVRAARGMRDANGQLTPVSGHQRAILLAKAMAGTIGMAAAYTMDKLGEDDDKGFAVFGTGPADFNKQKQLRETGWIPNSIRVNGHYYDYRLTPLALGLAIIGNMRDAERWGKLDEKDIQSRAAYATLKAGAVIFEMSFLSGINQIMDMLKATPENAGNKIKSYLTRNAGTVVPALFKQVDRTFDPTLRDNSTIQEGLLREVPVASHLVKPRLNLLGEPIPQTTGPISIFFSKERSDPVWNFIVKNEAWISTPARTTVIGFRDRKGMMTEDEYYTYVKDSGVIIRKRMETVLAGWPGRTKEQVQKRVDGIVNDARENVKKRLQRERMAAK